jgi:hypothetical protein
MVEADKNGDGQIDFDEFVPAFLHALYDEEALMSHYPEPTAYPFAEPIARSRRDAIYEIFSGEPSYNGHCV